MVQPCSAVVYVRRCFTQQYPYASGCAHRRATHVRVAFKWYSFISAWQISVRKVNPDDLRQPKKARHNDEVEGGSEEEERAGEARDDER